MSQNETRDNETVTEKIRHSVETLSRTAKPGIKAGAEVSLGMIATAITTQSPVETVLYVAKELPSAVDRNLKASLYAGTAEQPAQGTAEQPAQGTAEQPAQGTAEQPAQGTAEQPAQGTAEAGANSSDQAQTNVEAGMSM